MHVAFRPPWSASHRDNVGNVHRSSIRQVMVQHSVDSIVREYLATAVVGAHRVTKHAVNMTACRHAPAVALILSPTEISQRTLSGTSAGCICWTVDSRQERQTLD